MKQTETEKKNKRQWIKPDAVGKETGLPKVASMNFWRRRRIRSIKNGFDAQKNKFFTNKLLKSALSK